MRYGAMNFPVLPVLNEIDEIGQMEMDFFELAMSAICRLLCIPPTFQTPYGRPLWTRS